MGTAHLPLMQSQLLIFTPFIQEAHEATQVANDIVDTFVTGDNESVKKCRKIAARYIGNRVSSHTVYETDTTPIVFATGHCHIDTAWLWPFDETKRTRALTLSLS